MFIYKTTNLINGKIYIGQTIRNTKVKYFGSGIYITKAVKKYGKKNFKREIICECLSIIDMNKMEIEWIKN